MIYLDYAATTPISEEALNVFNEASKKYFGNSSSLHEFGTKANDLLNACRKAFAKMIHGDEKGIYFTSGGSESNQLAVKSLIDGNKNKGNHLITSETEHSSLNNLFKKLEKEGFEVTYLPLRKDGVIDLTQLRASIRETTILASIHHANSEVGAIQPLAEIGNILQERHVIFHTDAVQTFGHLPIDVKNMYIDALSVSSHKIYGPKGTGMCYINPRVIWKSQIENTTHEGGFRPGTVDVPSILAFTTAAQLMVKERERLQAHFTQLNRYFIKKLQEQIPQIEVVKCKDQLPKIIGLAFPKLQGQFIMLECNKNGIAVSTGSACQVGKQDPSRTMLSLGKTKDEANQFIRISLGKMTTKTELDRCIDVFQKIMHENDS